MNTNYFIYYTAVSTLKSDIEIKTFLNFFVKMSLPYSLKVGEKTSIPVSIHNYERKCINVRNVFWLYNVQYNTMVIQCILDISFVVNNIYITAVYK